ncbi:acyltransferase [Jongsikchunia kroppenstedtii]|uniref:acyltransferase n=1 Tax=Jongsikchunia kroppenstedtii TaxID=1121721 RepID=UPI000364AE51|nr:acyltransferase [Jongsikchunia kroppenstedtii]
MTITGNPTPAGAGISAPQTSDHPAVRPAARAHMYQLDLVRVITFSCVILAHALSTTTLDTSAGAGAITLFLHFTRNAFFALTGFVLMFQYFHRTDFKAHQFWPRRLKPVLVPYLVWSFVYWIYSLWSEGRMDILLHPSRHGGFPANLGEFVERASWGMSGFQMYFLFVTMQAYLLFPALIWLVRRTVGNHLWVLAGSALLQVLTLVAMMDWHQPAWLAEYSWHAYATFLPYQFFIVAGALAAVHREAIEEWLRGRGAWIAMSWLVAGGVELVLYLRRTTNGDPVSLASSPFQLTLFPFIALTIVALYSLGLWWSDRRVPGSFAARAYAYGANRSFGVFLVHVLILQFLVQFNALDLHKQGWLKAHLGGWTTVVVYLLTIGLTLVAVEVLRRLPGSYLLTGRSRIPLQRKVTAPATA